MFSPQAVSRHIRAIRRAKEVSQARMARHLGLPTSVVNRSDLGKRAWRFHEVEALAELLGVDFTALVPEEAE
jgi:ribosome-binding protein aMBF1 (putative translation factor)